MVRFGDTKCTLNTSPPDSGPHEMVTLRAELDEARLALKQETTARLALEQALEEATATERHRFARAMHATVAQSLTAIYFTAKGIEMRLQQHGSDISGKMASLCDMIHQASNELHAGVRGLEPDRSHPTGQEESSPRTHPLPAGTPSAVPDSC